MTDAIIEAAARALIESDGTLSWEETTPGIREWYTNIACAALAAVTPLIRAAALEEAAKVAEDEDGKCSWPGASPTVLWRHSRELAYVIRALKEQP